MRRVYTKQHRFYCGIDLHARLLAICIVDHHTNEVVLRRQIPADQQLLLHTLAPYRPDVCVCVECLFAWYWVADLCKAEGLPGRDPSAIFGTLVALSPRERLAHLSRNERATAIPRTASVRHRSRPRRL